jgi:hypothetical protein
MATIGDDSSALRRLIEAARGVRVGTREHEAAQRRVAWVLGKQEILVEVAGVRLNAWLSETLWLTVNVSVTRGWDSDTEKALYASVKRTRRITAMLVMAEWADIRALCAQQGRENAHLTN